MKQREYFEMTVKASNYPPSDENWLLWQMACAFQVEVDAGICKDLAKNIELTGQVVTSDIRKAGVSAAESLEDAIINQEKE